MNPCRQCLASSMRSDDGMGRREGQFCNGKICKLSLDYIVIYFVRPTVSVGVCLVKVDDFCGERDAAHNHATLVQ